MLNQNKATESTIELSPCRESTPLMPKILVASIVTINVMALAVTSMPKVLLPNVPNERMIIEQGKNTIFYPNIKLKCRNGQVLRDDEIADQASLVKDDKIEWKITAGSISQQFVRVLKKENAVLRNKLKNSLPIHTVVYITGSSSAIMVSIVLLLLRFMSGVYTVDPYFIISALIIAITLLETAIVSLKDWKNFLDEKQ